MLFGDSTLTSRTVIWDFIQNQISRKPWLGWGFHSFWLVGPNAPSVVEAPYWIRHMTGSHNGYLDVRLETGYIGLAVFLLFLVGVLYAMERVRQQDPVRAWLLLSLALYVIVTNFLETVWLVTDEPLWFLFLLVVGETARYSRSARQVGAPTNDHTGLRRLGSVRKCHLSPIASGGYRRLRA
jgi:O-antigen ligase